MARIVSRNITFESAKIKCFLNWKELFEGTSNRLAMHPLPWWRLNEWSDNRFANYPVVSHWNDVCGISNWSPVDDFCSSANQVEKSPAAANFYLQNQPILHSQAIPIPYAIQWNVKGIYFPQFLFPHRCRYKSRSKSQNPTFYK